MSTRKSKYTKERLSPIVESNFSWAGVLKELGLYYSGGNLTNVRKYVSFHGLATDHFTGQLWSKGKTAFDNQVLRKNSFKTPGRVPDEEVFKLNGHPIPTSKIKKRLLLSGWENKCSVCGLSDWLSKPMTLHLDHVNGNPCDNRKENLRILCPNCHQQTETWGSRNRKVQGRLLELVDNSELESEAFVRESSSLSPPTT